jgi:hypothetical protein
VIDFRAGSGHPKVQQRRARASLRESLTHAWHAFGIWRRTRPFWGGLLVIVGASEMLATEQAPLSAIAQIGFRGLAAYLTPIFILLCGLLLWLSSIARGYHSLLAILLASYSWVTSNLGGFFIGMMISVLGGALAFAWMTDADYESSGSVRGRLQVRLPRRALDVVSGLKERVGRPSQSRGPMDSADPAEPEAGARRALHAYVQVKAAIIHLRRLRDPAQRLVTRARQVLLERVRTRRAPGA